MRILKFHGIIKIEEKHCGEKTTIISVEIASGESLNKDWHIPMQVIKNDKGKFIDKLPKNGGYDWQNEIGKTVSVIVKSSKGRNWLSPFKSQSFQNKGNPIATKTVETKEELPQNYDINENEKLKEAYDYIKQNVPVIFLTGGAGTGKSTFIKYLKNNLKKDTGKNCVVLAPTGVAAINAGGQTIHSFFHWNTDVFEDEEITIGKFINPIAINTDLFIIDEISMVHSWMIDHIDYALRLWCDKDKPFGGKQLLLIGDCFQLPPVVDNNDEEKKKYYARRESPFFFAAHAFDKISNDDKKSLQLEKIYRQKDEGFVHILNRIRECKSGYEQDIEYLNKNCFIETKLGTKNIPPESLLLCTTNAKADEFNNQRMFNLQQKGAKSITFKAFIQGDFNTDSVLTPASLEICVGAKIMVTKNITSLGLVNGDMGKVLAIGGTGNSTDDYVDIEIRREKKYVTHHVTRETWQSLKYEWNERTQTITQNEVGTFNQIPLKLGWAVTIHKSQGLTLDSVAIDADDAWDSGQIYVALSRAKTLNGILLTKKIPVSAVKVDKYVQEKYRELFPEDEKEVSVDIEKDYNITFSNDGFTIDNSEEITSVTIGGIEFELYHGDGKKIGKHAEETFSKLISHKLIPETEIKRMLDDEEYCFSTFGVAHNFPTWILKLPLLIKNRDTNPNKKRYYATCYCGYYICSQWEEQNDCSSKLANWLVKLSKMESQTSSPIPKSVHVIKKGSDEYKSSPTRKNDTK